jgi:hypothetical protein
MSLPITDTYAGTDSDGKIWGIEGTNLIIILFGVIISLAILLLVWTKSERFGFLPYTMAVMPAIAALLYVFFFRQGKPKAFDTDFMETLITGRGWAPGMIKKDNY